jgi:hypothetical protein
VLERRARLRERAAVLHGQRARLQRAVQHGREEGRVGLGVVDEQHAEHPPRRGRRLPSCAR